MLNSFPSEAKQTFWGKKQPDSDAFSPIGLCVNRLHSLVPYYFTGINSESLVDDPTIRRLFGPLITGMDNYKEWEETMDVHSGLTCPYIDPVTSEVLGPDLPPEYCTVRAIQRLAKRLFVGCVNYPFPLRPEAAHAM